MTAMISPYRSDGSPTMNIASGPSAEKRKAATIGVRPEHLDVSQTSGEWVGRVRLAEHLGSDTFVYAEVQGVGPITVRREGDAPYKSGDNIFVTPQEARIHRFDANGVRIG